MSQYVVIWVLIAGEPDPVRRIVSSSGVTFSATVAANRRRIDVPGRDFDCLTRVKTEVSCEIGKSVK
jgi:hypothetical protein